MTLDDLRRFAVVRSLFAPTTLQGALDRLGFVQADPIRAPARAQDLTLRHRVKDYRTGDLERRYAALDVREDFFVNYGFVTSAVHSLMHPREAASGWPASRRKRAQALLEFVREAGTVHPRAVDAHFAHGRVTNYWGGSSSATTHLLDDMHYRGLLRIVRRERGVRIYGVHEQAPPPRSAHDAPRPRRPGVLGAAARRARIDALVDVVVRKYAPLPRASLAGVVGRLRYAVPQWRDELRAAFDRARLRLAHARVDDTDWYWPPKERVRREPAPEIVRLLTPFDPVVWDRPRFARLWGWEYRFEAYTPAPKRKLGYYALPLLWGDRVIGWGNVSVVKGELRWDVGYTAARPPSGAAFARELEAEIDRLRRFLGLT